MRELQDGGDQTGEDAEQNHDRQDNFDEENEVYRILSELTNDIAEHRVKLTINYEILEHYEKYGFGKMAIISKNTTKIIGYCGFEICTLDGRDQAELGFRLIKSERGQGYIVEAASKLIENMKNRGFKNVIAFSEEQNLPAHNLLKKLGFSTTFRSNFLNMDVVFFNKNF